MQIDIESQSPQPLKQERRANFRFLDPTQSVQNQEEVFSNHFLGNHFSGEAIVVTTQFQTDSLNMKFDASPSEQKDKKMTRVKTKKTKITEENANDLLFEDLDHSYINWKPYIYFMGLYLINATIILIIFIGWSIYELLHTIFCTLLKKNFGLYIKTIVAYIIDILMAVSVLFMYPQALMKTPKHYPVNFQYWAISSLIFTQSFILLQVQSYMMCFDTDPDQLEVSWEKLKENMINLGLGKLMKKVQANQVIQDEEEAKQQEIEIQKVQLQQTISKSIEEENIDDTLFFFSLDSDNGISTASELHHVDEDVIKKWILQIKQNAQIFNWNNFQTSYLTEKIEIMKKVEVLNLIKKQGFRGKRHILDNLLWPQIQQASHYQELSISKTILIFLFVLSIKVAYPVWAIMMNSDGLNLVTQYLIILNFVGCYMNMIYSLYGLLLNDDLQGKKYILNVLETLLVPNKKEGRKQKQQDVQADDEEDEDNGDVLVNKSYKLDLSCNMSLESWDNARRLTLMLDRDKLNQYETTFSFLAIYLLYTYIILSQDFLGINLFPSLHKFFRNPIQEYNTSVDFILVSLLFLIRVDAGSQYNATFNKLQNTVKGLQTVLSELNQLFDYYFSDDIIYSIENYIYRNISQKIYTTSADKLLYTLVDHSIEDIEVENFKAISKQLAKKRLLQLCATMEKLVDQIKFDADFQCHKFFGLFKSDITKVFSTFLLLIYIFFHSKIKKYLKKHQKKQ